MCLRYNVVATAWVKGTIKQAIFLKILDRPSGWQTGFVWQTTALADRLRLKDYLLNFDFSDFDLVAAEKIRLVAAAMRTYFAMLNSWIFAFTMFAVRDRRKGVNHQFTIREQGFFRHRPFPTVHEVFGDDKRHLPDIHRDFRDVVDVILHRHFLDILDDIKDDS